MESTKFYELTTLFHRWKVIFNFFFRILLKCIFRFLILVWLAMIYLFVIQGIRSKTRSNNLSINKCKALLLYNSY